MPPRWRTYAGVRSVEPLDSVLWRFVTAGGQRASSANPAHAGRVLGLCVGPSLTAVPELQVLQSGYFELHGYAPDTPLFLAADGGFAASPPGSGFSQQVAVAISSYEVVISLSPPIVLA